jgi:hypothetical protein
MTAASQKKKTPNDATEFEREQLRFFLTRDDLAATLTEINPSIAWLPLLAEMKLIGPETQLAPWLERNFFDPDAVREVAANIRFFGPETAELLEFRLNHQLDRLTPLLEKSWRLIIRYMRTTRRGVLQADWFEIAPRIKHGDRSPEVLERLARVLRPELRIDPRFLWPDEEDRPPPERPSDLIEINYEVENGVTEDEVLSTWPAEEPAERDARLLTLLTNALTSATEDALAAGVESNDGYGISDVDVPSVAQHPQNASRSGFLPIVRVIAELWTRLARKNASLALPFVTVWGASSLRLVRRLALFTAADAIVPPDMVASLLMSLPRAELFLTNSAVEVYRLIHARSHDLSRDQWSAIEHRIMEGPPAESFRQEPDIDESIARCRFDLLGDLQRRGVPLGPDAHAMLADLRKRWPNWQLRPPEQAGFHIWTEGSRAIAGDPGKLQGVSDAHLVAEAKRIADRADFMEGDAWQALCQSDPERALRGLEAEVRNHQWPAWAWNPFLWAAHKMDDPVVTARIAQLLLECPKEQFSGIAATGSWWLNEKAKALKDELLWPLWDAIEEATTQEPEEASDE